MRQLELEALPLKITFHASDSQMTTTIKRDTMGGKYYANDKTTVTLLHTGCQGLIREPHLNRQIHLANKLMLSMYKMQKWSYPLLTPMISRGTLLEPRRLEKLQSYSNSPLEYF